MFRVSDGKPTGRRRTSGGRHAAPRAALPTLPPALRPSRVPTRVAQGGVALGLALSMGAVVVTADEGASSTVTAVGVAPTAPAASTAELRAEAVEAAKAAVDEVSRLRSDATQVAVPQEVLAELDEATAVLEAAIEDVDVTVDRTPSVSRDTARDDLVPTADAAPAADPAAVPQSSDAAAASDAEPTAAPTQAPAERLAEVDLPDTSDPATTPLREALDRVKEVAQVVVSTTEQKKAEAVALADATQEAARIAAEVSAHQAAQRAAEEAARLAAEEAARRASWKVSLEGYANGRVPASALCGLSFDGAALLRCDAAESFEALDAAFVARFGRHLEVSDSYRSYSAQVACRATKGSLCATPGTSNHGMGVAVDLGGGVQSFGTAQHQWMRENAPAYGWTLPEWARSGGSKPEPWHWEYLG